MCNKAKLHKIGFAAASILTPSSQRIVHSTKLSIQICRLERIPSNFDKKIRYMPDCLPLTKHLRPLLPL